jgi:uncharacterized membrane protein YqaE (UPF0057 family)
MKSILSLLVLVVGITFQAQAFVNKQNIVVDGIPASAFANVSDVDFATMTPAQVAELTGQKLTFKQTLALKAAQKQLKKETSLPAKPSKGLAIVLVIFLGFIGMLIYQGTWNKYVTNTLLWSLLCGIPGIIYGIKVINGKVK